MADDAAALTRELASLARLELSDEQSEAWGGQLETVLGYIRRLHAVDVDGVQEYESADDPGSGLRDDDPGTGPVAGFDAERALAGAPSLRDRSIAVPRFLKE